LSVIFFVRPNKHFGNLYVSDTTADLIHAIRTNISITGPYTRREPFLELSAQAAQLMSSPGDQIREVNVSSTNAEMHWC